MFPFSAINFTPAVGLLYKMQATITWFEFLKCSIIRWALLPAPDASIAIFLGNLGMVVTGSEAETFLFGVNRLNIFFK